MNIRTQAHCDTDQALAGRIDTVTFRTRFPRQIEHVLRLVAERLQNGLRKDALQALTCEEIHQLSGAVADLYQVWDQVHDHT